MWPAAEISGDGRFRYLLSRSWIGDGRTVTFIGLNPSTADARQDDPTIRRCVGFAKCLGASTLLMVNLFGYRSTDPRALLTAEDPVGPDNDAWLERAVKQSDVAIAAWGNGGSLLNRGQRVAHTFAGRLQALELTKGGMPKHPLYIRQSARPVPYDLSLSPTARPSRSV